MVVLQNKKEGIVVTAVEEKLVGLVVLFFHQV